jgi:hypothetical protein
MKEHMMQSAVESLRMSCATLEEQAVTSGDAIQQSDDIFPECNFDLNVYTLGFEMDHIFSTGSAAIDSVFDPHHPWE